MKITPLSKYLENVVSNQKIAGCEICNFKQLSEINAVGYAHIHSG